MIFFSQWGKRIAIGTKFLLQLGADLFCLVKQEEGVCLSESKDGSCWEAEVVWLSQAKIAGSD